MSYTDPNDPRIAEKARRTRLKTRYNLSIAEYDALLVGQEGVCAICRQPERHTDRRLSVDHDHEIGTVRGLLCFDCNVGLGKFADSSDMLLRAIRYLTGDNTYFLCRQMNAADDAELVVL